VAFRYSSPSSNKPTLILVLLPQQFSMISKRGVLYALPFAVILCSCARAGDQPIHDRPQYAKVENREWLFFKAWSGTDWYVKPAVNIFGERVQIGLRSVAKDVDNSGQVQIDCNRKKISAYYEEWMDIQTGPSIGLYLYERYCPGLLSVVNRLRNTDYSLDLPLICSLRNRKSSAWREAGTPRAIDGWINMSGGASINMKKIFLNSSKSILLMREQGGWKDRDGIAWHVDAGRSGYEVSSGSLVIGCLRTDVYKSGGVWGYPNTRGTKAE
jgi:hypothetical protein